MRSILYIIAVILIIGWLLGVFVYSASGLIHILLVLAIVSILLSLIRRGVELNLGSIYHTQGHWHNGLFLFV